MPRQQNANDTYVRRALVERFGRKETRGLNVHTQAALAVAVDTGQVGIRVYEGNPPYGYHGEVTIALEEDPLAWVWNSVEVDEDALYYEIGEVENVTHAKKYCNSKHWVVASFELKGDTADTFHGFMTPAVNYGTHPDTLSSSALVCWDSNQDRWIAEMEVAGSCGSKTCPVYWAATVTFCDSTGTSTRAVLELPNNATTM